MIFFNSIFILEILIGACFNQTPRVGWLREVVYY
jgi:hypothetical protein